MKINHQMFKEIEFNEMMAWLNGNCKNNITIISLLHKLRIMISIYFMKVKIWLEC